MADHAKTIQELTAENDVLKKRIHELEAMEMALQASETRFKSIVATSQEWIWTIDTQGVHTYSNPTIEKILGFTPDEIVRQGAAQYIILAEDIPKMMEILARSIEQKKAGRTPCCAGSIRTEHTVIWKVMPCPFMTTQAFCKVFKVPIATSHNGFTQNNLYGKAKINTSF